MKFPVYNFPILSRDAPEVDMGIAEEIFRGAKSSGKGPNQSAFIEKAEGLVCVRNGKTVVSVPITEILSCFDRLLAADQSGELLKQLLTLLIKHEGED